MSFGVFVTTQLLSRWSWYWSKWPAELREAGPLLVGVLMGLGTVLAELPGSFVKRQLDIAPGGQKATLAGRVISIWDQGDFVLGVFVALSPLWIMSFRQAAWSFIVVAVLHLGISVIGHALGARKTVL